MLSILQKIKNNNIWQWMQGIIVSFTICIAFGVTTSNVLYLLVGGLYLVVRKQRALLGKREYGVNIILSCLFSVFMVLGNIEKILEVDFLISWPITVVLCIYGFFLCFELLIGHLLVYLRDIEVVREDTKRSNKQVISIFFVSLAALLVVWGIGLAVSYPGNTTRDSNGMIQIALGNMNMRAAIPSLMCWHFAYCGIGDYLYLEQQMLLWRCVRLHIFC